MIQVRDIFQLKFGRIDQAVELFRRLPEVVGAAPADVQQHGMTDISGSMYTFVSEMAVPSMADWESMRSGLFERPAPKMDGSEQLTPAERTALDVLELSWPLTLADVKSRYKELVKLHHPDANGGARDAEEKLKEINAAYSTLRASEHLPAE